LKGIQVVIAEKGIRSTTSDFVQVWVDHHVFSKLAGLLQSWLQRIAQYSADPDDDQEITSMTNSEGFIFIQNSSWQLHKGLPCTPSPFPPHSIKKYHGSSDQETGFGGCGGWK
jgi:hypothetical protein